MRARIAAVWLAACPIAALAQQPPPPADLAQQAAARYPQPVRVGDLAGRYVLQPTEAQHVLGRVSAIVRGADGGLLLVIARGGTFAFGSRRIAVPIAAVALLGQYVALMDITPQALDKRPTFDGAGTEPVPPESMIDVGITRPFH